MCTLLLYSNTIVRVFNKTKVRCILQRTVVTRALSILGLFHEERNNSKKFSHQSFSSAIAKGNNEELPRSISPKDCEESTFVEMLSSRWRNNLNHSQHCHKRYDEQKRKSQNYRVKS